MPFYLHWNHEEAKDGESQVKMGLLLLSHFSRVQLFETSWIVAHQAPLSRGFSRQAYWSGLTCPAPGELPNPGIKSLLHLLHWQAGSSLLMSSRKLRMGLGEVKDVLNSQEPQLDFLEGVVDLHLPKLTSKYRNRLFWPASRECWGC